MSLPTPGDILIIEDTVSLALLYKSQLEKQTHRADMCETGRAALKATESKAYDLILLDLGLPDMDGFDILRTLRDRDYGAMVIVTTADGALSRVIEAMQLGAADYLVKPFSEARLLTTVNNTLERQSLAKTVSNIERALPKRGFHGFIGQSLPMQALYATIGNVAASKATVLITGESGTGKELTAEAIHRAGRGENTPFVALNCGAIPRELFESEMFGHRKGSFTGAISDYDGVAKRAHGGTLFLDEVCEMEPDLQTKLLRFLQTETIQPVGAAATEKVDVRVVCATNRNPMEEVRAGRFREDLFYRLNVVPIDLPPLRARGDDVQELADYFLDRYGREEGKDFTGFSDDARWQLKRRPWPGNVRELQNTVRQIAVLAAGGTIEAGMLPAPMHTQAPPIAQALHPPQGPAMAGTHTDAHHAGTPYTGTGGGTPAGNSGWSGELEAVIMGGTLAEAERMLIETRIRSCGDSIPKAARTLGVSPSTLYRKREGWEDRPKDRPEDEQASAS